MNRGPPFPASPSSSPTKTVASSARPSSSAEGVYHLASMVPGRYRIVAKLEGFRTFERTGLVRRRRHHADHEPHHGDWLARGIGDRHRRQPAHRPHRHRRRRQHRHRRAGRAAGDEPQLLRHRGPAAGRAVLAVHPDGQRHHRLERAVEPEQQRLGRRRLQRRRRAGHQLGRPGAHAARGHSGVRSHHQHVRGRVRTGRRRDRQRRHQERHQQVLGRGVRLRGEQRPDRKGLLRRAGRAAEGRGREARVGLRAGRADRQEQGPLLRQPRAPGRQAEPHPGRSRPGRRSTSRSSRTATTGTR